jgi:hypothetical protein
MTALKNSINQQQKPIEKLSEAGRNSINQQINNSRFQTSKEKLTRSIEYVDNLFDNVKSTLECSISICDKCLRALRDEKCLNLQRKIIIMIQNDPKILDDSFFFMVQYDPFEYRLGSN